MSTKPFPPCDYSNDGFRITQPGKFEGEPVFVPHLWNLALEGFADADDGRSYRFTFSAEEKSANPALARFLGRKRSLSLWEDSQGFVHCS